ncbi:MAG: DUF3833 domain-containing protein [Halioglobus sp.]|nr:DUF3833 domain-containing protein [Halioglobus sp.]
MIRSSLVVWALALLAGCAGVTVEDYRGREPTLRLEAFFDGPLSAHGVVKNRSGRVIRSFNAEIAAYWEGDTGTLEEDFVFDDGEEQRRVWTLTRTGEGSYTGTAGDVVGEAALALAGNSLFMDYVLRIPYGDDSIDVRVDDRMYLVSPTVLINESVMSKFGVRVGSLLLVIERRGPGGS